jgi:hypothetical protein
MSDEVPMPDTGHRILGFGLHAEVAAAVQDELRSLGFRATTFALTNDEDGDRRLVEALAADDFDAVAIGGGINGQMESLRPDEGTTRWFNRILNVIHANAPHTKIVLVRGPHDAVAAIESVLGPA